VEEGGERQERRGWGKEWGERREKQGRYKRENKRARRGEERGEVSEVEGEGGAGREGRMETDRGGGKGEREIIQSAHT